MTRKDFEAIARIIREARPGEPSTFTPRDVMLRMSHEDALLDKLAVSFASYLAGENARFDRVTFLEACKGD